MDKIKEFVKRLREKYKSKISNNTLLKEYEKEFDESLLEEDWMVEIVMDIDDEFEKHDWILDREDFVYHNKNYTPPKKPPKNQQKLDL